MEFKVWVDGIQRVVCGVTEDTTCQDVIFALAHATGKTGRFSLLEKWRDNERLLVPSENPLKVIQKWGEYSAEVKFILRYSSKLVPQSKETDKLKKCASTRSSSPNNTNLRKSLSFSGARGINTPDLKPKSKCEPIAEDDTSNYGSLDTYRGRSRVSPSREGTGSLDRTRVAPAHGPRQYSPSKDTNHKSYDHDRKSLSPYGSLDRATAKVSPYGSPDGAIRSPGSGSSTVSPHDSLERKYQSSSKLSHPSTVTEYELDKNNLPDVVGSFSVNEFEKQVLEQGTMEDLRKLVELQKERLNLQESQMKIIDSEITFWEGKEQEFNQVSNRLSVDIHRLEQEDKVGQMELGELEVIRWVDKLEVEKQNEKTLQSELTLMRSKIANCEAELLQCKNKIQAFTHDVDNERREIIKQEQEQRNKEIKIMQEITDLQKQLNEKLEEHKNTQDMLDYVVSDVNKSEEQFAEKIAASCQLEKELKNLNLEMFIKTPLESLSPVEDGSDDKINAGRRSPRPMSARKITGNPQSLSLAVATSKNPHGMWV